MKEYKNNEELIDYLISKNVIVNDRELALKNIEKYSYYSIINGYKAVFKDENSNYKENTSFEEIFALYEFDKNIKAINMSYGSSARFEDYKAIKEMTKEQKEKDN